MISKIDIELFLFRILADPTQRRNILIRWHSVQPVTVKGKTARLADIFETFIQTILYEPVAFHLNADRFYVFGQHLPIRYEWLPKAERDFLISLFANRMTLFKSRKEYENNQFDLSGFTFEGERDMVSHIWRRQIVRDFVWMVAAKNVNYIVAELVASIQGVLLNKPANVFLGCVNDALQGRMRLSEVLAWNHTDTDEHPEVALYRRG
jgi:hypothetical protein